MIECLCVCAACCCCRPADEPLVQPVVSVYPAASSAALQDQSFLLCAASDMAPPPVRFSWTRQREGGPLEELPPAGGGQLELRGSGSTAAIRLVDRDALHTYRYLCNVQHEGGTVKAQAGQGDGRLETVLSLVCQSEQSTEPCPSDSFQTFLHFLLQRHFLQQHFLQHFLLQHFLLQQPRPRLSSR